MSKTESREEYPSPLLAFEKTAAVIMLRWEIGGLPVVDGEGKLAGIITYTDLLRELIARGRQR